MSIETLDGNRFGRALIAGADWVRRRREHLNAINVYPVPDGDTGTNMALSLSATAASIRDTEETHLARVLHKVSEASVLGAKGNSGLILAHWFLGLRGAIGEKSHVTVAELAKAFHHATETVYHAIENPVEGTILTVMRGASEAAREASQRGRDLLGLLDDVVEGAEAALKKTPELLSALGKARVVDAGGEGYLNLLQGMQRSLRGAPLPEMSEEELLADEAHPPVPDGDLEFRYCTEVVVRGKGFDADGLRGRFHQFGDSLLIATTGTLLKLHVHTNHPNDVFDLAAKIGAIEERKVDDMLRQREERQQGVEVQPIVPISEQPQTVAIVSDSTSDVPEAIRREWGIEAVPLQLLFGDDVYRDQVDLSTQAFYDEMKRTGIHPTTSQPAPRSFLAAFERVRADREVLAITVSSKLSGTHRSALSALKLAQQRVEVLDSGTASMAHGWVVYNAARLAAKGADLDQLLHWSKRWKDNAGIIFAVGTLEYLRRGGRIGAARGLIGALLGLKPVLTFRDGKVLPVAKARSSADVQKKLLRELASRMRPGARLRVALVHGPDAPDLGAVERELRKNYDVVETIRSLITGVVGCHTGPEAWGVAYQVVDDDDPLI